VTDRADPAARAGDPGQGERRRRAGDAPEEPAHLRRALPFGPRLHGGLSLELAGHFSGMAFDPALLYGAELDALAHPVP